jgi:outer membrane lipoprotein-sorting protein
MKKLFSLAVVLISIISAHAQNDPNAKKILDAVSAKVKSFTTITANFSINSVSSKGKNNGVKSGVISIKGAKYVLAQGKMQVICDGAKTYNFDGAKTITVTSLEESGQSLSPQKILSGDYAKDFVCKLIGNKAGQSEIEMKPIDARKNFSKVNVFVDNAKSMITKAFILDKSNNTLQVSFTNLVSNKALDNAIFVFNKAKYPKDVEILD